MLKNKIQPSKYEGLIGFIKWFPNPAAPHPATRKVLEGFVQDGRVYEQNEGGTKKFSVGYSGKDTFPLGKAGGLIWQVTLLVLVKKFQVDWFKIPLPGEAETAIRLGFKFGFGDVAEQE